MNAQDQLRNEILATCFRYSQESDVSIIETVDACHEAARIIVVAALNAKDDDGVER